MTIEGLKFTGSFENEDLEHVGPLFESILDDRHYRIIVDLGQVPSVSSAAAVFLGHIAERCRAAAGELVFVGPGPELFPDLSADEDLSGIRVFPTEREALRHFGHSPGDDFESTAVPAPRRPPPGELSEEAEPPVEREER